MLAFRVNGRRWEKESFVVRPSKPEISGGRNLAWRSVLTFSSLELVRASFLRADQSDQHTRVSDFGYVWIHVSDNSINQGDVSRKARVVCISCLIPLIAPNSNISIAWV